MQRSINRYTHADQIANRQTFETSSSNLELIGSEAVAQLSGQGHHIHCNSKKVDSTLDVNRLRSITSNTAHCNRYARYRVAQESHFRAPCDFLVCCTQCSQNVAHD
jgi:hypothetical protein